MARESLFVRHTFLTAIKELSMAERGRLFTAMLEYSIEGNTPVLGGAERIIWPIAQDMIDADNERYDEVVAKRSAAGKASANARQQMPTPVNTSQHMPTSVDICQPTPTPFIKENKTLNSVLQKKSAKFTPPTLEEVAAYCKQRGNSVDPKTFYDYFTEGNWIDADGKQVKNWKQKIITWEKYNQPKGDGNAGKRKNDYQRDRKDVPAKDWGI